MRADVPAVDNGTTSWAEMAICVPSVLTATDAGWLYSESATPAAVPKARIRAPYSRGAGCCATVRKRARPAPSMQCFDHAFRPASCKRALATLRRLRTVDAAVGRTCVSCLEP